MNPTLNPQTYNDIALALSTKFFISLGSFAWIRDRDSDDILYVFGEVEEAGRLSPSGLFAINVPEHRMRNENYVNGLFKHFGITEAQLVRSTNAEPAFHLFGSSKNPNGTFSQVCTHKTKAEAVIGVGTFEQGDHLSDSGNLEYSASIYSLGLRLLLPESSAPQQLSKVPRKIIAQLREHVEKHYQLTKIQAKLLKNEPHRYDLWNGQHKHLDYLRSAFQHGNLKERGRLMTGNDAVFWRYAFCFYSSPASLIDSCRGEYYDAAGVRGADATTLLNLQPAAEV